MPCGVKRFSSGSRTEKCVNIDQYMRRCLQTVGMLFNGNGPESTWWTLSSDMAAVWPGTQYTRNKAKTVLNVKQQLETWESFELHNFHTEPLRVYSHRTQKVSLSSNTNFWWIFSYFALTFSLHVADGNPWGKSKMKKHGKKQKQTASGKVLGKHLFTCYSKREILHAHSEFELWRKNIWQWRTNQASSPKRSDVEIEWLKQI